MIFSQLPREITAPPVLAETDQFSIKLAESEKEIDEAKRLRYEVFNLEQGKGLETARSTGVDEDEFDQFCLHLVVRDKNADKIIGTYRAQLGSIASSAKGFYSSRQFDIEGLDEIAENTLELGRSCVAREYRKGAAVALLWLGISELLVRSKLKLMLGCVSLEESDPAIGWALYQYFLEKGRITERLKAVPKKEFELERPHDEKLDRILDSTRFIKDFIPPLLKGYLRLGTKICGVPAYDYEFGTIDFLILLDTYEVPKRYLKHFNYNTS